MDVEGPPSLKKAAAGKKVGSLARYKFTFFNPLLC